jgi:hypothetical protein
VTSIARYSWGPQCPALLSWGERAARHNFFPSSVYYMLFWGPAKLSAGNKRAAGVFPRFTAKVVA